MATERKLKVGDKVGRLTLLEPVVSFSPSGKRETRWKVVCSCPEGTVKLVLENSLRRDSPGAKTRSCGCLRKEKPSLAGQLGAFRVWYRQYQKREPNGRLIQIGERDVLALLQPGAKQLVGRKRAGSQEYLHTPIELRVLPNPKRC